VKKLIYGVTAIALFFVPAAAGQKKSMHAANAAAVARGKYLVESVGMCGNCHTPRNDKGEPIKEQWLKGAPLGFQPIGPMPVWADKAPNIAGLPGWEKTEAIKFLVTGIGKNELPPRPPMPLYRFSVQDAQAVVAYLKSLDVGK
jgi:mono/diheme cytochrome c family protein